MAERLSLIAEDDLAPEGELPAPVEEDVRAACAIFGKDRRDGTAPVIGDVLAPAERGTIVATTLRGFGTAATGYIDLPPPDVPQVSPTGDEDA